VKLNLYKIYLFSLDGAKWVEGKLTRVDKHMYPYCANYSRWLYIKEKDEKTN